MAPKGQQSDIRLQLETPEREDAKSVARTAAVSEGARVTAARIAELEDRLARLQSELAVHSHDTGENPAASSTKDHRRMHRHEIDPGVAVPAGVPAEMPAPMDWEAENARMSLEKHPGYDLL